VTAHDHDDAARAALSDRVAILIARLDERHVLTLEQVDGYVEALLERAGPSHGARVVARAWIDPAFRERLLADGTAAVRELGYDMGSGTAAHLRLKVVENTPEVHNLIVCTLCSCYPIAILGPSPTWYKSVAYRSRAVIDPRGVMSELGLDVDPAVRIRVWDSSAETRYLVLPMRPEGSEGLSERELAHLVSRDAMIGTGVAGRPAAAAAS
jgi:nitrile hydratase